MRSRMAEVTMSIRSALARFTALIRDPQAPLPLGALDLYNLSRAVQLGDSGFFENLLRTKGYTEEAIERMWSSGVTGGFIKY